MTSTGCRSGPDELAREQAITSVDLDIWPNVRDRTEVAIVAESRDQAGTDRMPCRDLGGNGSPRRAGQIVDRVIDLHEASQARMWGGWTFDSGNRGSSELVVQELLPRGVRASSVGAVARSLAQADDLSKHGVHLRERNTPAWRAWAWWWPARTDCSWVSNTPEGQRAGHHRNVIEAAKTAGVPRVIETGVFKADEATNALAVARRVTEWVLRRRAFRSPLLRHQAHRQLDPGPGLDGVPLGPA